MAGTTSRRPPAAVALAAGTVGSLVLFNGGGCVSSGSAKRAGIRAARFGRDMIDDAGERECDVGLGLKGRPVTR